MVPVKQIKLVKEWNNSEKPWEENADIMELVTKSVWAGAG
jgi:hypothetical protein